MSKVTTTKKVLIKPFALAQTGNHAACDKNVFTHTSNFNLSVFLGIAVGYLPVKHAEQKLPLSFITDIMPSRLKNPKESTFIKSAICLIVLLCAINSPVEGKSIP